VTEFLEVVKNRRSIRAFRDKPVEKEKIDQLLDCALRSPTGRAIRPWEFIVVTDPDVLKRLANARGKGPNFLAGAPLGIVALADGTMTDLWIEDTSIAATVIQLTAEALGLGSCWMQIRDRKYGDTGSSEDYVREVLGIPEKYRVECIIAVGYKKEEKQPYTDAEIEKLKARIHYNKF
jgi:nitroreductase